MAGNVLTVIQARKGSTRLPAKVLLDLAGKTALAHVIERLRRSRLTGTLVVATTVNPEDLAIVKLCADLGVRVYCGCEEDPLERYYQAARLFGGAHVVRIKADCPLIDPQIVDDAIRLHLSSGADYTGNTLRRTYPVGQDVEIFTRRTLGEVWRHAALFSEREHITLYVPKHPEMFAIRHLEYREDLSGKRWTLDNPEDYQLLRVIFENLHPGDPFFGMQDVLDFLTNNPELERINAHIRVDAGVQKSLQCDRVVAPPG
ncbi:MAG: glycosyltransferase family protein [Desulfobacterales bacterium]|jgi:spore coat polysaccharide biosynthesis protein SpsF|nr:glycosyltransferase family protein [Desulfobacterales bacterium]